MRFNNSMSSGVGGLSRIFSILSAHLWGVVMRVSMRVCSSGVMAGPQSMQGAPPQFPMPLILSPYFHWFLQSGRSVRVGSTGSLGTVGSGISVCSSSGRRNQSS